MPKYDELIEFAKGIEEPKDYSDLISFAEEIEEPTPPELDFLEPDYPYVAPPERAVEEPIPEEAPTPPPFEPAPPEALAVETPAYIPEEAPMPPIEPAIPAVTTPFEAAPPTTLAVEKPAFIPEERPPEIPELREEPEKEIPKKYKSEKVEAVREELFKQTYLNSLYNIFNETINEVADPDSAWKITEQKAKDFANRTADEQLTKIFSKEELEIEEPPKVPELREELPPERFGIPPEAAYVAEPVGEAPEIKVAKIEPIPGIKIPEPRTEEEKGTWSDIKTSWQRGKLGTSLDIMAYDASLGYRKYEDVLKLKKEFEELQAKDPVKAEGFLKKGLVGVAGMLPAMIEGYTRGIPAAITGAAGALVLGSAGPQAFLPEELISVPAAAGIGLQLGSMEYWYKQGAGDIYSTLLKEKVRPELAAPIAHIGGAPYAVIEFLQVDRLIPGLGTAAKKVISSSLKKTIGKLVARYGTDWATNVGQEGLQRITSETAIEVGKLIDEKKEDKSITGIARTAIDILSKGWDEMVAVSIPMLFMLGPKGAIETSIATKRVLEAKAKPPITPEVKEPKPKETLEQFEKRIKVEPEIKTKYDRAIKDFLETKEGLKERVSLEDRAWLRKVLNEYPEFKGKYGERIEALKTIEPAKITQAERERLKITDITELKALVEKKEREKEQIRFKEIYKGIEVKPPEKPPVKPSVKLPEVKPPEPTKIYTKDELLKKSVAELTPIFEQHEIPFTKEELADPKFKEKAVIGILEAQKKMPEIPLKEKVEERLEILKEGKKIPPALEKEEPKIEIVAPPMEVEKPTTEEAKSEIPKATEEQLEEIYKRELKEKPKPIKAEPIKDMLKWLDTHVGVISTILKLIKPKLKYAIRRNVYDNLTKIKQYYDRIRPFLEKKKKLMSKNDQRIFNLAEENRDIVKINELANKYGLQEEYKEKRKVLDELYELGKEAGFDFGYLDNFSPRAVKHYEKLITYLKGTEHWTRIEKAMLEKQKQIGIRIEEREALKKQRTGLKEKRKQFNEKINKLKKQIAKEKVVDKAKLSQLKKETLALGKLDEQIRKLTAKIGGIQIRPLTDEEKTDVINNYLRGYPATRIEAGKPGILKSRKIEVIDEKINRFYYHSDEALISYINKMVEAISAKRMFGKATVIEDNKFDIDASIGEYVKDLIDKKEITYEQEKKLQNILRAYFRPKGPGPWVSVLKDFLYAVTLANPFSAITQLGDLAFANANAGVFNNLKSIGKEHGIKVEDVGIENRIAHEFSSSSKSSKTLLFLFKGIGFSKIDRFGKERILNSAYLKYLDKAKKNPDALYKELKPVFEEETDAVIEDILSGDMTENVKFLMFNDLLDVQPVAKTEVPEYYLRAGNWRILYMLKTFSIKQLDVFRNKVWHEFRTGDKKKALYNFARYAGWLVALQMGTDAVKDWLAGRAIKPPDIFVDNLLKLAGFTKYIIYRARREGLDVAFYKFIAPPFRVFADGLRDVDTIARNKLDNVKDLKIWRNIPWFGNFYYWRFGLGEKIEKKYAPIRKERNENVKKIREVTREVKELKGKKALEYLKKGNNRAYFRLNDKLKNHNSIMRRYNANLKMYENKNKQKLLEREEKRIEDEIKSFNDYVKRVIKKESK